MVRNLGIISIVFFLSIVAGCAPGPRLVDESPLTAEQELTLGHILSNSMVQHLGGPYPDAGLENYVNQVARRLMAANGNQIKQVRIANHSAAGSFALTGGVVVVSRGLLQEIKSEHQLAALLASEAGHFQAGHVAARMRPLIRGRAVFLQDVQPGDPNYSQRLLLIRELTDLTPRKGSGSEKNNNADIAAIDLLVRSGYPLSGFFELDEMWKHLTQANSDTVRSVLPQQLPAPRLQAVREYIAESYPGYHSDKGTDSNAYNRQMLNLHQSATAYQLYDQARYTEAAGEETRALQLYHQAIQRQPQSLLLTALGMAYLRGEDLTPARRYLRQAVAVDADYYQSRLGLGYIHLQRSDWTNAVSELEASLALQPTLQGVFLLAEAEVERGNSVRARNLYRHVLDVDGRSLFGRAAKAQLRQLPR